MNAVRIVGLLAGAAILLIVCLVSITTAVAKNQAAKNTTIQTTAVSLSPNLENAIDSPLGQAFTEASSAAQETAENAVPCLVHVDEGWTICEDGSGDSSPYTWAEAFDLYQLDQEPTSQIDTGIESGYFVGWGYSGANYSSAKLSLFSNNSCNTHTHLVNDLGPIGWSNIMSSMRANTVAGCGKMDAYGLPNQAGAVCTASPAMSSMAANDCNNIADSLRARL